MASNWGRLARDSLSPYRQESNEIADVVERLMKEREQGRQQRAWLHLADVEARLEAANKQVTDLKESLQASQHRVAEVEASAAQAKVDAARRIARLKTKFKAGARLWIQLCKAFQETGNDTASTDAHAENESAGSAADVNSSANAEEQSNQPEQQVSPSSSNTTANTLIKREESPLHLSVASYQPSEGSGMSYISLPPFNGGNSRLRYCDSISNSDGSAVSSMSEDVEIKQQHEAPSNNNGVRRFSGISPDDLLVDEIYGIERERRRELKEEDEAINGRGEGGAKRQRTE
ncbi:uncharacterized protein FFUJ_05542 [Fusarium fujikuroi IMI 58289]|uniref:Uncharacterized protein n=2 Tax=Fusarium fujikuroi TaxID=5127 RepID=S0E4Q7_GIBF5|nr:uncharacterized protein FFUJ_05542 [Fusarium fujikuroi IMI 58289]QGI65463.1 hypothetical protein CEK27_009434 [Fusarium fujikuroi]QGI82714.1 hypothetical protein CEK25_009443 [Fusarium fujikuroi]QGI96344.1 hypothetical protein CEK26_009413 [Fusarium fujikuroi]CCT69640.1 uncharacterized protein FFUJ_05542 [Fusarium fujikuroi IMI 58289]SCO17912.1 uncharacterized protein FFE2_13960 [Fusarium fujikuroi]